MATPDPSAATDVPRERARLPALPQAQSPREWSRVRRAEEAAPEHLDLEFLPDGTVPPVRVGQVAAPTPVPVPVEVQPLEDEVTDHGVQPTPLQPSLPLYADLSYELRVCRLLEDIRENTRKTELWHAAEAHRRKLEQANTLDLQPGHLREERRTLIRWVEHWCLDPKLKSLVAKALAVGAALGTSIVGSAETMSLLMELVERLLRAWVSLP